MLDTTAGDQVAALLDGFGSALEAGDVDRAAGMFQEDCYWRDLVAFTWNIKTVEGRAEVADMLRHQLAAVGPTGWRIADGEVANESDGVTTAWISFETRVGRGYGLIRLREGKIWTLLTSLVELKGHEEPLGFDRPLGAKHGAAKQRPTWKEERETEQRELGIARHPNVLIVGGGQGGIALGARLRQLGVPTIIIETVTSSVRKPPEARGFPMPAASKPTKGPSKKKSCRSRPRRRPTTAIRKPCP
jgi:putative flavoprotein involved in K+ transport